MNKIKEDINKAQDLFTEITWLDIRDRKMLDSKEELIVVQTIVEIARMIQKERLAKK